MSDDKTMKALNALRRLPENRVCGTCRFEDRLGFSAVCTKFQIFVCGDCKSAHQAYSHRCKSVTMSNWTAAEVDALREEKGGGNAMNRRRFFAKLPSSASTWPRKSSHPDERKAFVLTAYSDRAWESDEPIAVPDAVEPPPVAKTPTAPASTLDLQTGWSSFDSALPAVKDRSESAPAPDMLDWGAFDAAPAAAKPATPAPDMLDWGAFDAAPAAAKPATPQADSFSAFGDFLSAPSASPPAPLVAMPVSAASSQMADLDFFAAPPAKPSPAAAPFSAPLSTLNVEQTSKKPAELPFAATVPAGAAAMPPMPTRPMSGPMGMGARMPGCVPHMPPRGPPPMANLAAQMPAGAMAGMPMPRMGAMPGRAPVAGMYNMAGLAAQMPEGAMAAMPMPGMGRSPMQCGA